MDKDKALGAKKPIAGIRFPTDKAYRVRDCVDKDKALSIKKPITGIKFPMNKAHRVRNYMDKDEALSAKKPITFKGVVKKHPFGFNPSGYSQGKGFKTKKKALTLYY